MGRHPIGQRGMTNAERQRRFVARLRDRAAMPPAAPAPMPPPFVAPEGVTIRVPHLAMAPGRAARWLCQELDKLGKAQAFADAFNEALVSGGNLKPMD